LSAHSCAFSAAELLHVTATAPCWERIELWVCKYACTSESDALLPLSPELLLLELPVLVLAVFEFELLFEFEFEFEFEPELLLELELLAAVVLAA
jgi:hypothetical protein